MRTRLTRRRSWTMIGGSRMQDTIEVFYETDGGAEVSAETFRDELEIEVVVEPVTEP